MSKKPIVKVFLCLCLMLIPLGMSAQGKKVTISAKDMALTTALRQVEQQSGYYKINYPSSEVSRYKVTANVKNETAPEAVKLLLKGLPFESTVNGQFIQIRQSFRAASNDQRKAVRGRLLGADGEPLIGATVMVEGTNIGTVTDINGNYVLEGVDENQLLTYSYIGKRSMQRKAGSKNAVIILEDETSLLEDVVVTGYQTISKERTTGSFNKITAKDLEDRPTADISSALQGLVAGMQATENEDGSVEFAIRGQSTLYANAQPLVVVDGFPIEGTFTSINPNDVESVTILKDAAAASIWGSRSANGVIVVTTKKSREQKLKVDGKAFWRYTTTPDLNYILNQADSKTTVDYEIKGNQMGWDMGSPYQPSNYSFYGGYLSQAQALYFKNKYFGLSESKMNAGLDRLRNTSNRQQLKDYLMQTALLQQYNVSIQGGGSKLSNYLSLMYEKNDERTIKRGYNRFMLNYNNEYQFNKHITATVGATFQKRSQDFSGATLQDFASISPYDMLKNEDGSYVDQPHLWDQLIMDQIDTASFPYSDFSYNLLREVENRTYITSSTNYRIQLGLNFKIVKGLTYDIKYQYERNESETNRYDNENTSEVRDIVNFLCDMDFENGTVIRSYAPKGGLKRSSSNINFNDVFRNQLNYNNVFGVHDITAIAGIEMSKYVYRSTTNPYVYGYDEVTNVAPIPWYGQKDNIGNLYDFPFYSTYYYTNYLGTSYSDREDRYVSYYGNIGYMYDERYGASFSIRSDGSNFVSKDESLRWSPMWSVGLKWNVHKEDFMKNLSWVNRLSLRGTYGLNGNAEKTTSPETLISISSNAYTHSNVASIVNYGNPLLKWERTKTFNIGADFSLFRNVLSGKIDYYNRYSIDVIGNVSIPSAYGTTTQRFNNAEISNRGIELELTGNFMLKNIGLGIRSTLTYAYNNNKVEKLYNPALYCYELIDGAFVEGKPIGAVFSYKFAGTEDGVPYVYGEDNVKSTMNELELHNRSLGLNVLEYSGTTIAPHTLGWNTQLMWNGLQLSVFITGKFGGVFRSPFNTVPLVGSIRPVVSAQISMYEESDGTLYPTWPNKDEIWIYRWDRYIPYLSYFVEKADFIKLKEVDLSWNLPKRWLRTINIQGASLFLQARDLGVIWAANKYNYDPEWLPGTNRPSASISFGANINF